MTSKPAQDPERPGRVFETFVRVRFHEIDGLGHVNNAAYLNYLEQAAIDHATYLGIDMPRLKTLGGVFVARRHEIEFVRPAFAGDLLRVETWLGEAHGARIERNYRVYRVSEPLSSVPLAGQESAAAGTGELVVQAVTEWIFMSEQGRPRRIPDEVLIDFQSANGG